MRSPLDLVLTGIVRGGYGIWSVVMRLIYRPKLIFVGEGAREAFTSPCVIVSNHKTHLDGTLLPLALRRRVTTFVARDWYDKPRLRPLFTRLPYLPMDRKNMDTEWLSLGEAALAEGKRILLFPEGRTSRTDELHPFQPGFALLARRAGVPVVPVAIPPVYRKFRRNPILIGAPIVLAEGAGRLSLLCRQDAREAEAAVLALLGRAPKPCMTSESEEIQIHTQV